MMVLVGIKTQFGSPPCSEELSLVGSLYAQPEARSHTSLGVWLSGFHCGITCFWNLL